MRSTRCRGMAGLAVCIGVLLAGCGGEGAGAPPELPQGTAKVRVHIEWPELPSSRILLSTLHHVEISVTGPGIGAPLTGTLTRPATTLAMDVPAGTDRVFSLVGRDADGDQVEWAPSQTRTLVRDSTVDLEFTLYDMWEPADETSGDATPIPTDGTPSPLHGIEGFDGTDWFVFDGAAGETYTAETADITVYWIREGYGGAGQYSLTLYDAELHQLTVTSATVPAAATLTWTALTSGPYLAKVYCGSATFEYRLRVRNSGTTGINISIK